MMPFQFRMLGAAVAGLILSLTMNAAHAAPNTTSNAEQDWTLSAMAVERVAMEALLAPVRSAQTEETVTVRRGETLDGVLSRLGVSDSQERYRAVTALSDVFNPRTLRAGQSLKVYLQRQDAKTRLLGLALDASSVRVAQVSRLASGDFRAHAFDTPQTKRLVRATGEIRQSLYVDATAAGVPQEALAAITDLLAYSVDFQREIHPGDPFEIVFEHWTTPSGESVRMGDLLYVGFAPRGRPLAYWRFVDSEGRTSFYDEDGQSARRLLMRTPIDGARLSSPFGPRRHPILGYQRAHKGTDFAAPPGTPIYAAGDGVVERSDWYGGYGRYIRIRHANGYKTAYAHMSRFARGMRPGKRVRQGQTIGYVGTSGASTGPHLHYEVIKNGVHVNPMRLKGLTGRRLANADKTAFASERARIDALRKQAPNTPEGEIPNDRPSEQAPSLLAAAMAR